MSAELSDFERVHTIEPSIANQLRNKLIELIRYIDNNPALNHLKRYSHGLSSLLSSVPKNITFGGDELLIKVDSLKEAILADGNTDIIYKDIIYLTQIFALLKAQQEAEGSLKDIKAEANKILDGLKDIAKLGSVAKNVEFFNKTVAEHKAASKWWLWASGVLFAITLYFIFWFLCHSSHATGNDVNYDYISSKILLFVFLSSALLFSSKIYMSNRHNFVVNEHRVNALSTYELLV
ncbi:MAG: hypothetical protein WCL30_06085, partial [Pseudomonadota bacterium]